MLITSRARKIVEEPKRTKKHAASAPAHKLVSLALALALSPVRLIIIMHIIFIIRVKSDFCQLEKHKQTR